MVSFYFLGLAIALPMVHPLRGEEAPGIMEGTRALYRGDYQQARTLAFEYLETHSEDPQARILLARAEIAQGQYESAYDDLRKTLDLDDDEYRRALLSRATLHHPFANRVSASHGDSA